MLAIVVAIAVVLGAAFTGATGIVVLGQRWERDRYIAMTRATGMAHDALIATCMGRYPHGVLTADQNPDGVPVGHDEWLIVDHVCARHRVVETVCADADHAEPLSAWLVEQRRLKERRKQDHKRGRTTYY